MVPENIIVIDRDSRHLAWISGHLRDNGYSVRAYSGFDEGLKAIRALPEGDLPDLILVDLPNKELARLTQLVHSRTRLTQTVKVAHATSAREVVAALRCGAQDFILKPIEDISELDSVINHLFARNRVFRSNQRFRRELEETNKELKVGIAELKADQNAGLKVQMKMLPENDQVLCGVRFEHFIKPSLYLSGDFLDYFELTEDKVLFYFADVSGHGASSAFVTVLLKNLSNRLLRNLRRGSSDDALSPVRYLKRVNHELLETKLGKHVTMFVGIFDAKTRILTYSVGAHFPMPVLVTENTVRCLEGTGMPVGLFDPVEFVEYSVSLPEPFRLVLFSDGVLEILPETSLAQKERRLLELVEKRGQTIQDVRDELNLDTIQELPDDIAILTVSG